MAWKMLVFFIAASFAAWLLLFAGIGTRRDVRRQKEREHTRTSGVITDYVPMTIPAGRGKSQLRKPIVEFTAEGQVYRLEYANLMAPEQFPVGTAVVVLYDVSDPSHFHLEADPAIIAPGAGAIRVATIWILASAALAVALAVFVGGARPDFRQLWRHIQMLLSRRR